MMIVKEFHGWSDARLFEACNFSLVVRRALGCDLNNAIPVASTYYLLKQKLAEYESQHDINIMSEEFEEVTRQQAAHFGVLASKLRMDSTLIGSNIASCTRLALVIGFLQVFYKSLAETGTCKLRTEERSELEKLSQRWAHQLTYHLDKSEQEAYLKKLGELLHRLMCVFDSSDSPHYPELKEFFFQQYEVHPAEADTASRIVPMASTQAAPETATTSLPTTERIPPGTEPPAIPERELATACEIPAPDSETSITPETEITAIPERESRSLPETETTITVKAGKDIKATGYQSPYDLDAAYREKNGTSVKGYSVNVTETCHEHGLNLVTVTAVEPATASDTGYFQDGVEQSERSVQGSVNQVSTDGAYHSPDNQKYAEQKGIEFYPSGMQGKQGRYDLEQTSETTISVKDRETGETQEIEQNAKGKYKYTNVEGQNRYFTPEQVEKSQWRQKIESIPKAIRNLRNNVEATMFQVKWYLRNNKTRYRGLYQTHLWATCRCFCINVVRIVNHLVKGEVCPKAAK
ncbi:MAG: hypothetical protein GY801_28435 [bacterium]|nr:hypothetical protein [bacterium]